MGQEEGYRRRSGNGDNKRRRESETDVHYCCFSSYMLILVGFFWGEFFVERSWYCVQRNYGCHNRRNITVLSSSSVSVSTTAQHICFDLDGPPTCTVFSSCVKLRLRLVVFFSLLLLFFLPQPTSSKWVFVKKVKISKLHYRTP